jgi:hypothetical protein
MKTKGGKVIFKVSKMIYDLKLPAGLKVKPIPGYIDHYWLDEFPEDLFPIGSFVRHDAIHHGIWLHKSEIDFDDEWLCSKCLKVNNNEDEICIKCGASDPTF